MQVLCTRSNSLSDIHCPFCGQGFRLYWERSSRQEQEQALGEILQTLSEHHASIPTTDAHPTAAFNIPDWSGHPHFSGAALLGGFVDKLRLTDLSPAENS